LTKSKPFDSLVLSGHAGNHKNGGYTEKMATFINLTAHKLTADQIEAAKQLGASRFLEAADILPPDTVDKLRNCPSDKDGLLSIAYQLIDAIKATAKGDDSLPLVHLPCGSPALMWKLCDLIGGAVGHLDCVFDAVFSHSVRDSVETLQPDGSVVKNSVFRFEKFIVL
jgi:hypothetical protein